MNWLFLLGCGGAPPESEAPPDIAPEAPSAPEDPIAAVRDRLAGTPPELGKFGRAYAALAKELGVAAVHCPTTGTGRIRRIYGTARDRLDLGVSYRLVHPDDPVSWSPYFDEVPVEDGWAVFLAAPGSTTGFLRGYPVVQRMTWPTAEAGEVVRCTAVNAVPERIVTGQIQPAESGTVDGSCSAEPVPIAGDGTFIIDARPPCALWLLTGTRRSSAIAVPDGSADKLELGQVAMVPDAYQLADGSWTEEGRTRLGDLVKLVEDDISTREAVVDKLDGTVDALAVQFWRGTIHTSRRDALRLRRLLLEPAAP